jgi:predicted NBD/HSP70 family sugar kinase
VERRALTLLGLDIGTTHVKACAYDEEGRLLASARRRTPAVWLPGGGAEYHAGPLDPSDIGRIGVQMAVDYLKSGEEPSRIQVKTGLSIVTRDNLEDPNISKYLYKAEC